MIEDIGSKINQLRTKKNLTLKQLAERCDLSVAFLSQIERSAALPAIISLNAIASALDVDLSYFFNIPKKSESIVKRSYDQNPVIVKRSNYIYDDLSRDMEERDMEIMIVTILPGEEENYPAVASHVGEEFIYVIEGIIVLIYEDKEYEMFPGDSAHYKADVPHSWRNRSNKLVKLLSVNTPIIFREKK